jgi:hypothetical protein
MNKLTRTLGYVLLITIIVIVLINCAKSPKDKELDSKTPLGKKLDSIDIKDDLRALYPDVKWGMTTSSTHETNGVFTKIEFNIAGPEDFLTQHPDAEETLKQSIIKKCPEAKDIPMTFNFKF